MQKYLPVTFPVSVILVLAAAVHSSSAADDECTRLKSGAAVERSRADDNAVNARYFYHKGICQGENGRFAGAQGDFHWCAVATKTAPEGLYCRKANNLTQQTLRGGLDRQAAAVFIEALDFLEQRNFTKAKALLQQAIPLDRRLCSISDDFATAYGSTPIIGFPTRDVAFYAEAARVLVCGK